MEKKIEARVEPPDPRLVAVELAGSLISQAIEILEPEFQPVPSEDPKGVPAVPHEFAAAAVPALDAVRNAPELIALCKVDPAAISARLQLVTSLSPLANRLEFLTGIVGGSLQSELSKAYAETLPVYRVAKAASSADPTLKLVVAPLKEMYAKRKKAKKKATDTVVTETTAK